MNILAIDLGTTSCKLTIFDSDLQDLASTSIRYSTSYPAPGWAEQNPNDWWQTLIDGTGKLLSESSISSSSIAAIGIDSMSSAMVAVDRRGNCLYPAPLWMDRRAEEQSQWILQNHQDELNKTNGNRSDPSNFAPKILWLKKHHPDIYKQTFSFLHANGYLVLRLTGQFSMDHTEGGLTQIFDTRQGTWDDNLIELFQIDRRKLPAVFECQQIVGQVSANAARDTGLSAGTPVVAGSMDMCAAALGSGVLKSGQIYISAGTVTVMGACLEHPAFHPDMHIYGHASTGLYIQAAGVDYGGAGLKWFREIIENDDYHQIDEMIEQVKDNHNPLLFLPYMVGQRAPLWNSSMSGAIAGLHPSVKRVELYKMFMQGNAFGIRRIIELLKKAGHHIDLVKMTGGCSHSQPWMQIFADTTGLPFEVPDSSDVTVLGSAAMAAIGTGMIKDYRQAFDSRIPESTYTPQEDQTRYLDRLYNVYEMFLDNMIPVMKALADLEK